jgi:branched-chain amino acid transport system permease protein
MLTVIYAGLSTGAVYALVACGINLSFLPSRIFNLAQAQTVMVGAVLSVTLVVSLKLSWPTAVAGALAVGGAVGLATERIVNSRSNVSAATTHTFLVSTLGVGIVMEAIVSIVWGNDARSLPFPVGDHPFALFSGRLRPAQVGVIALALLLVLVYERGFRFTSFGLRYIAAAEDRDASEVLGVNVRRVVTRSFVFAGAFGGLTGFVVAPLTLAHPQLGSLLLIKAFVVLAIGGFGSQRGALVGGAVVGLCEALTAYQVGGQYSNFVTFLLLIITLGIRPAGLFGSPKPREV